MEIENVLNKEFSNVCDSFLTSIWLSHGQLWVIIEGRASLARC